MTHAMKRDLSDATVPVANLEYRIVGDSHVVFVTQQDGRPAISGSVVDGNPGSSVEIHAAKIDGTWTLVP